jgi:hypothetical protein
LETPITLEDFVECGKVYEQLRKNPDSDINQVAKVTHLSLVRVKDISKYLQKEKLISKKLLEENTKPIDVGRERIIEIFAPAQTNLSPVSSEVAKKNSSLQIKAQNNEKKENKSVCLSCQSPLPQSYYDDHDGLCPSCYYKALLIEAAKQERRSGIYGSDRAGTW